MQLPDSHSPDRLRFGHPDWVRTLSRGGRMACWSLTVGATAAVAGEVFAAGPLKMLCHLGSVAGATGLICGAWLLSSADPNGSTPPTDSPARWILRLALVAAAAGGLLRVAATTGWFGADLFAAFVIAGLLGGAVDVAAKLALLRHGWRLASRIPDPRLANKLGTLLPAYGLSLAAYAAFDTLRAVPMLDHLALAASVGLGVITLVVLKHLRQLVRGLVIQTDYARGIWSRGPAARPSASGLAA